MKQYQEHYQARGQKSEPKMQRRHGQGLFLAAVLSLSTSQVNAAPLEVPETPISREAFQRMGREAGFAASFPVADSAKPYGLSGFDIGIGYLIGDVHQDEWDAAVNPPSYLHQGYLRAVKGLPLDIDLGLMAGKSLGQDDVVAGGELRYALLAGKALPSIGLRAAYTQTFQSKVMDLQTASLQADISYGFLIVTPFAGLGATYVIASPEKGVTASGNTGNATVPHAWLGAKFSILPFIALTAQAQYGIDAPLLGTLQLSGGL